MHVAIFCYVWPEPESSAAGLRTRNLVESFSRGGWEVTLCSHAGNDSQSKRWQDLGAQVVPITLNDSATDRLLQELKPDVIIYDRFVMEEQFGARVRELPSRPIEIIDAQDLHFLRRAREKGRGLVGEDAYREIAAFHRVDRVWVLSDYEQALLTGCDPDFGIPSGKVRLHRFHYSLPVPETPGFEERLGFVSIGNFRHAPNWDSVKWLKASIWPGIRRILPQAEIRIYGSYPSKEAMALHDPKEGFLVLGPVDDAIHAISKCRVELAALRFGAGIKGKISDAWYAGTPVVTTSVGAEGMHGESPFPGVVADEPEAIIDAAVRLHQNRADWERLGLAGHEVLESLYDAEKLGSEVLNEVLDLVENKPALRAENFIGQMLNHHSLASTKYFSRWLELKGRISSST